MYFFYFDSQITQKIQIKMQSYVEIIWCSFFVVFGFKCVEMDAKKGPKNVAFCRKKTKNAGNDNSKFM